MKLKSYEKINYFIASAVVVLMLNACGSNNKTEMKRLVLRGRNTSYDSQVSTYKIEDFACPKLWERYKKWTGNSFDEKDLVSFGSANEQGYLTNAGALIADESPIRWFRLSCTSWNGLNKNGGTMDAFDDAEYSGSVLSVIDNGKLLLNEMRNWCGEKLRIPGKKCRMDQSYRIVIHLQFHLQEEIQYWQMSSIA